MVSLACAPRASSSTASKATNTEFEKAPAGWPAFSFFSPAIAFDLRKFGGNAATAQPLAIGDNFISAGCIDASNFVEAGKSCCTAAASRLCSGNADRDGIRPRYPRTVAGTATEGQPDARATAHDQGTG